MDNAANNTTFVDCFGILLLSRRIPFDHKRQIRYDSQLFLSNFLYCLIIPFRCFPHIVHLVAGDIIDAVSKAGFGYPSRDVITVLRGLITTVCALSLFLRAVKHLTCLIQICASLRRRDAFSDIVKDLRDGKDLQLLCDVKTHWASTCYMIQRALDLREVCSIFYSSFNN